MSGKISIVKLSNKFYSKESIEEAINAFEDICSGEIINNGFEVRLIQKKEIDEPLDKEFCNYVLGIMKNK
jgi:hypothetical protein